MKIDEQIRKWEQELNTLKSAKSSFQSSADELDDKIDKLTALIDLPRLRAKYNNTYWRYQNAYSRDQKWFEYIRVDNVISTRYFKGLCVGIDSEGKLCCESDNLNLFMLEKQINRFQFNTFLRKFKSKIK